MTVGGEEIEASAKTLEWALVLISEVVVVDGCSDGGYGGGGIEI